MKTIKNTINSPEQENGYDVGLLEQSEFVPYMKKIDNFWDE